VRTDHQDLLMISWSFSNYYSLEVVLNCYHL